MSSKHVRRCAGNNVKHQKLHQSTNDASEGANSTNNKSPSDLGLPLVHKSVKQNEGKLEELPWTCGSGRNTVLCFHCSALATPPAHPPAFELHMKYKFMQAETKLLAAVLHSHGLREVSDHSTLDFNLLWTGVHMKAHQLQSLLAHQRVNHFPRSYELTRKDRLYKNIEKVQRLKGSKHFDFIPQTFVLPGDYRDLCTVHHRTRGPWIVKPVASSRGRGIYIVNNPDQIPCDETLVVAKYIDDPLLVGGYKCDLRLYVAVTSYDPLVVYLYEEGLVRLATVKYESSGQHLWNPCMHLCNYSINKYHEDYIKSEDPEAENVGHKWTLSALLRHLRSEGKDTSLLMQRVEDVIVKSILAAAPTIVAAARFVPYPNNCFELYGFDILIDSMLKPWLLEVNLSPSLNIDSPLDIRIKSAMLADLLSLAGLPAIDPVLRYTNETLSKTDGGCNRRVQSADSNSKPKRSGSSSSSSNSSNGGVHLTAEEARLVRGIRAEHSRRGGFLRIFPSSESWKRYGSFLDPLTGLLNLGNMMATHLVYPHNYNLLLHQQLYPELTISPTNRLPRYERALVQGHRSTFITAPPVLCNAAPPPDKENVAELLEAKELKLRVRRSLETGGQLSINQARRAFSQYLLQILARLGPSSLTSTDHSNTPSELCLKFLQKASYNLRAPFFVKAPSMKVLGKDRVAIIAKQLSEFVLLYSRETELFHAEHSSSGGGPLVVPETTFHQFLRCASESDLEEILTLHVRLYKCAHVFLGRCAPPPVLLKPHGLLQCLPQLCSLSTKVNNDCCIRESSASTAKTFPRLTLKDEDVKSRKKFTR